jgi:hypothetical protein
MRIATVGMMKFGTYNECFVVGLKLIDTPVSGVSSHSNAEGPFVNGIILLVESWGNELQSNEPVLHHLGLETHWFKG